MTGKQRQDDMKPELKDLMQDLQVAFNESVCESDRIAEILADIKRSGYDVLLALEVTIGMNTSGMDASGTGASGMNAAGMGASGMNASGTSASRASEPDSTAVPQAIHTAAGELNYSPEDREFLQGLHICVEH
jgi:hypothetical protein